MPLHRIFSSKITIGILIVFLVLFGNLKYKQWKNQQAIEVEKENLNKQAKELEQKKQDINNSLAFLNSQEFKEKIAREQLGLKKDGEVVYSFSESGQQPGEVSNQTNVKQVSNPRKWWDYFFQEKN